MHYEQECPRFAFTRGENSVSIVTAPGSGTLSIGLIQCAHKWYLWPIKTHLNTRIHYLEFFVTSRSSDDGSCDFSFEIYRYMNVCFIYYKEPWILRKKKQNMACLNTNRNYDLHKRNNYSAIEKFLRNYCVSFVNDISDIQWYQNISIGIAAWVYNSTILFIFDSLKFV